ncbi:CLUMA_CG012489, isoform A [Clunio marinus]|uniref:CLUMA_CG012489, isoform A n=1 Tax=Clunio marinus TaxID=568069 RepID=A0A1J1IL60_9DIPT|nr:CLUMA_CG012489, isoform A [Clunio marinus]
MEINFVEPQEIDFFIQSIQEFEVFDIGSKNWLETHEKIIKLNQQAIVEASGNREEVVKELLIIKNKLPILIHEVLSISVWRKQVLPKLSTNSNISGSFFIYSVLFHESVILSLLELVLYHENSCVALEETVVDMIDYCVEGIIYLIGLFQDGHHQNEIEDSSSEEIDHQKKGILFEIGMKCIIILSYLCDNVSNLSVSVARRVTQTHDIPCLLSELLAIRPWLRKCKSFEKFIDGKWVAVEGEEILKVVKVEAQTWFCLRSIMFQRETFENYEINSFRQRELGKCSGLLNDLILEQLPPLADLKKFLCTLQISSSHQNNLDRLVLEVVPQVLNNIIKNAEKKGWNSIIDHHKKIFVEMDKTNIVDIAKQLNKSYDWDKMIDFEENQEKQRTQTVSKLCAACKKEAEKKCSRCQIVFYCCRNCQVKDWNNHKEKCYQYVV